MHRDIQNTGKSDERKLEEDIVCSTCNFLDEAAGSLLPDASFIDIYGEK